MVPRLSREMVARKAAVNLARLVEIENGAVATLEELTQVFYVLRAERGRLGKRPGILAKPAPFDDIWG